MCALQFCPYSNGCLWDRYRLSLWDLKFARTLIDKQLLFLLFITIIFVLLQCHNVKEFYLSLYSPSYLLRLILTILVQIRGQQQSRASFGFETHKKAPFSTRKFLLQKFGHPSVNIKYDIARGEQPKIRCHKMNFCVYFVL